MSRRHPDDLSGAQQALNDDLPANDKWHVIKIPAINEQGEALWPERYPLSKLNDIKQGYEVAGQSYLWESLYQQNPTADSLSLEWPDVYFTSILCDELPPEQTVRLRVLSVDPSKGSNAKTGDYCGIADTRLCHDRHIFIDPTLKRMPSAHIESTVVEMLRRQRYDGVVIESNGFQDIIARNILSMCHREGIHCPMFTVTSTSDKVVRIRLGLTPLLHQKRLHIWSGSTSSRLAVSQLREFPSGAHDDFPDSLNMAIDLIDQLLTGKQNTQHKRLQVA